MTNSAARSYRQTTASTLAAEDPAERARRNGMTPVPPTSRETHAAEPAPVPVIKGAVKVSEFPERSKYPFRQIADDGGIWCLDAAVFGTKPNSLYTASRKWAMEHGMEVKTVVDGGMVYVQFTSPAAARRAELAAATRRPQ